MKNKFQDTIVRLLAALALSLTGCASYHIQPVRASALTPWDEKTISPGYVFYESELYFLVAAATSKTSAASPSLQALPGTACSVTPLYLPNPNRPYRLTTFNVFAKSDFAFNFKDGWQLVSIADKSDNTGLTAALVGQIKATLGAATGIAPEQTLPQTFLLHPEFNSAGIITGFTKINVPAL